MLTTQDWVKRHQIYMPHVSMDDRLPDLYEPGSDGSLRGFDLRSRRGWLACHGFGRVPNGCAGQWLRGQFEWLPGGHAVGAPFWLAVRWGRTAWPTWHCESATGRGYALGGDGATSGRRMAALVDGTGWRMEMQLKDGDENAVVLQRV
jgi:hypothetical protein